MKTTTIDAFLTREGLEPEGIANIRDCALHCAEELRAAGWQGDGAEYDLGNYAGDREHLGEVLERPATPEECVLLERSIKIALGAA